MKKKLFLAGLALLLGVGGASCQFLTNAIQVITNPPSPFGTNPPVRISIITQHTNLDGYVLSETLTNSTAANGLYVSNNVLASVTNINNRFTSQVYSGSTGYTNWYVLDSNTNWFVALYYGNLSTNWGIIHIVPTGAFVQMAFNTNTLVSWSNPWPPTNGWYSQSSSFGMGSLIHQSYQIYTTTNTP